MSMAMDRGELMSLTIEVCVIVVFFVSIVVMLKYFIIPHIPDIDHAIRVDAAYKLRRLFMNNKWHAAAIAGMVFDTYSKQNPPPEEVGGGCAICLADYQDGQRRATIAACNHRFHELCIATWMKQRYTCPLCRRDLV